MRILYIDTSSKSIKIALIVDSKIIESRFEAERNLFEVLIEKIDLFLTKNNVKKETLTHVSVLEGPGGFTSLRIGVVTANTIAHALDIPMIKVKLKESEKLLENIQRKLEKKSFMAHILPFYGKEPNITKSKKVL